MIWICRKRWRPFRISPTKWHSAEFPSKPFNSGKKVSNILFRFRTTFEMFLFSSCELSFWHEFKRLCLCRRLLSHHANTFENKITFFFQNRKFWIFWFFIDLLLINRFQWIWKFEKCTNRCSIVYFLHFPFSMDLRLVNRFIYIHFICGIGHWLKIGNQLNKQTIKSYQINNWMNLATKWHYFYPSNFKIETWVDYNFLEIVVIESVNSLCEMSKKISRRIE